MELEFSQDQEELRDSVRSVLAKECPMSVVRAVVEDGVRPDALWTQMVELGWPALTIAESAGGLGLGAVELAVVAEELGRVMAPGPFLATVSQFAPAIAQTGTPEQQERFLGAVANGEISGSLAIAEDTGSFDPGTVHATATRDGDAWVLSGTKHYVVEGADVDELVVVARVAGTEGDDGVAAFVVPVADVTVHAVHSLDPSRGLATIELDGVRVDTGRMLGEPGPATADALRRAVEEAALATAMEMVGTCQTIFDISLEYAKQREQFGVPIGSFQAIKHKFADMVILLERARATCYFAAATIDEGDGRRSLSVSMAKAAAGDAQQRLGKEGIQIHGGIGYTWEHDMHLYVRRVKAGAALFGTAAQHRARVADLLGL